MEGILASAAIFSVAEGGERVVRLGKEVGPALTLKAVGVSHAVLGSVGGDIRIDLQRFGSASPAPASGTISEPATAAATSRAGSDTARQREETMAFRLGLQPRPSGSGFVVKRGAELPHLRQAGIEAGDVILGVNGSALDEERLMELSWQIANSDRTEFEVIRGGRKITIEVASEDTQDS